jgi:hypothetical protein
MEIIETKKLVPLELIEPNPKNGYRENDEIAKSISIDIERRGRLLVEVTITPRNDKPGHFWYVSGHQRGKAFLLLKRKEIPATIVKFETEEEEKDAIRGYNKGRIKCERDKAWEFAEERDKLNRKKGIRPDLTGEATGKTTDIIAREYPMKISGDQVGKYLNIWDNRKKLFDLVDEDRPDYPKISIAGADNIVTFLKERNALTLKDREIMNEVVTFIDGKLPERSELESAFSKAVPKLGKALRENKKSKDNSDNEPKTDISTNSTIIPPNASQDTPSLENHSISANNKGEPVSTPNTKNDNIPGKDGNAEKKNTNDIIVTPESPADIKQVIEKSVKAAETEKPKIVAPAEISGDLQKQEPSSIKESPIEPQVLYIKNGDGGYVEYTCKHNKCPFFNRGA